MLFYKIWYCISNMSEKQTSPTERDTFFQKAANIVKDHPYTTGAAVLLTGGVALAAGQAEQRNSNAEASQSIIEAQTKAEQERVDTISAAIEASYDSENVRGDTITIEQGGDLIGPAVFNVKSFLGEETYNEVKPLIYDTLELSAKLQGTVQPGDRFNVIETDLNPEANDGNEYIVVEETKVVHSNITELPSPETH